MSENGTAAVSSTELDKQHYVKLPVWRKICFGIGDWANGFSNSVVSSYLTIFYTDVFLIPAKSITLMMLLARIWDAINDPVVGMLADRTHTKYGRYRPWLAIGTFPLFIITILMFWAHPNWGLTNKLIYAYVTYFAWALAYTCVNLPYGSLNSVMTQDPSERSSLASYRLTFAYIGMITIGTIITTLIQKIGQGNMVRGYVGAVSVGALIGITLHLICAKTAKEIVPVPKHNKMPLWKMVKAAAKNKPFVIVMFGMLVVGFMSGRMAGMAYYFSYVQNNAGAMAMFLTVFGVSGMIGAFTMQYLVRWMKDKAKIMRLSYLLCAVLFAAQWILANTMSLTTLLVLTFFTNIFNGWASAGIYSCVPDTVEYGELQTGIRQDGFLSAYGSFWNKVGIAVGSAGVTLILDLVGYVPNQAQTATAIGGINFICFLFPAILCVICLILFCFYKLSNAEFEKILAQLQNQKAAQKSK